MYVDLRERDRGRLPRNIGGLHRKSSAQYVMGFQPRGAAARDGLTLHLLLVGAAIVMIHILLYARGIFRLCSTGLRRSMQNTV